MRYYTVYTTLLMLCLKRLKYCRLIFPDTV